MDMGRKTGKLYGYCKSAALKRPDRPARAARSILRFPLLLTAYSLRPPFPSFYFIPSILSILFFLANLALPVAVAAPATVQFSRQVLPLLRTECTVCHSGPAAPGGFSMETAAKLLAGGRHGAAIVPGKSGESLMIRYLLGEMKPQMPPGKPLPLDTIALLRRWIDQGAKIDSMSLPAQTADGRRQTAAVPTEGKQEHTPHISRLTPQPAPITTLAYSPDGKLLAVGGYQAVRLLDPAAGRVVRTLSGPVDQVLALAWSPDGRWLAAAGGLPGAYGEIGVWNTAAWGKPRIIKAHADTIYGIAWRPGAAPSVSSPPEFATASLDKTVTLWSWVVGAALPRPGQTLKDHADAVFCVAYSPDGKWLATGSADRSVKLYQLPDTHGEVVTLPGAAPKSPSAAPAGQPPPTTPVSRLPSPTSMRPVAALSHGDAVTALVFGPKSDLLVSACMDKQVRVWPVKAGPIDNPLRSQSEGEAVNAVAFSGDGSTFAWGAANHKVKLWNADVSSQKRDLGDATDWVYAVAVSPDGKTVAAGAGDGKLYLWNAADGKLLRAQLLGPASVAAAAGQSGK